MSIPKWLRAFGAMFHLCEPGHRVNNFNVLFGHQAAGKGEHGALVGTWVSEGARKNITIAFFFDGLTTAPKIDPKMIEELFHQARTVGISPSHICSYSGMLQPRQARR